MSGARRSSDGRALGCRARGQCFVLISLLMIAQCDACSRGSGDAVATCSNPQIHNIQEKNKTKQPQRCSERPQLHASACMTAVYAGLGLKFASKRRGLLDALQESCRGT